MGTHRGKLKTVTDGTVFVNISRVMIRTLFLHLLYETSLKKYIVLETHIITTIYYNLEIETITSIAEQINRIV